MLLGPLGPQCSLPPRPDPHEPRARSACALATPHPRTGFHTRLASSVPTARACVILSPSSASGGGARAYASPHRQRRRAHARKQQRGGLSEPTREKRAPASSAAAAAYAELVRKVQDSVAKREQPGAGAGTADVAVAAAKKLLRVLQAALSVPAARTALEGELEQRHVRGQRPSSRSGSVAERALALLIKLVNRAAAGEPRRGSNKVKKMNNRKKNSKKKMEVMKLKEMKEMQKLGGARPLTAAERQALCDRYIEGAPQDPGGQARRGPRRDVPGSARAPGKVPKAAGPRLEGAQGPAGPCTCRAAAVHGRGRV